MARFLRPGIGLSCIAYPAKHKGAVFEFTIGPAISNADQIRTPVWKINDGLKEVKQRAFGGNLDGITFGGSSLLIEDNRIIILKGDDSDALWNDAAALQDVQRIITAQTGAASQSPRVATP